MTPDAPQEPTHAQSARALVGVAGTASLATLCVEPAGYPFASVTLYAVDDAGDPILALSDLAEHSVNLRADPRAALLVTEDGGAPMASGRVTLVGRCAPLEPGPARDAARAAFLATHPQAGYVDFADFRLYRLAVESVRYVGGFGRMSWVDPGDYRAAFTPVADR